MPLKVGKCCLAAGSRFMRGLAMQQRGRRQPSQGLVVAEKSNIVGRNRNMVLWQGPRSRVHIAAGRPPTNEHADVLDGMARHQGQANEPGGLNRGEHDDE
jgi:hypothetical protein